MPRFSNKVAIITGSSNGIGRSTALLLAKGGAKVTITGRNAERLEKTRQQIIVAGVRSENINAVVADLNTSEGQSQLIDSTIQKFGQLDILINNAGASFIDQTGVAGFYQDISFFDKNILTNVRSVVELTQKARPYLEQTKGDIVNVSSIASGEQSQPDYYSMSKAALDQFTRNIALELIATGVRVNCVKPGLVSTGFAQAKGATKERADRLYNSMGSNPSCIPAGRCGQPKDIANVIAFLADSAASFYIVGQTIRVDGGTTLVMGMRAYMDGLIQ